MRRLWLALLSVALIASACNSGEVDRLRDELRSARARTAAAEEAARESDRDRQSIAKELDEVREALARLLHDGKGVVVAIPSVGSLSWECNNDREFAFTFAPEQATITVEQSIEGEVTRKRLDPGEELTTSFQTAEVHREWTVTYRHEPAVISAGISVIPAVRQGACFIRNFTLEQSRAPN